MWEALRAGEASCTALFCLLCRQPASLLCTSDSAHAAYGRLWQGDKLFACPSPCAVMLEGHMRVKAAYVLEQAPAPCSAPASVKLCRSCQPCGQLEAAPIIHLLPGSCRCCQALAFARRMGRTCTSCARCRPHSSMWTHLTWPCFQTRTRPPPTLPHS